MRLNTLHRRIFNRRRRIGVATTKATGGSPTVEQLKVTSSTQSKEGHADMATGHQRAVVKVLMLLAIPGGVIYALVNILREQYVMAAVELVFSLVALYFWRIASTTQHVKGVLLAFSIPMFMMISFSLLQPTASPTMFAFVFLIPVLIYPTLGSRQGVYITGIFYVVMSVQFFQRFGGEDFYQKPAALANVIVCSLAVWGIVHAYEKGRGISQAQLSNLATTDPLTGLNNRLGLEMTFDRRREKNKAVGSNLGMIMVDLDFFKTINDTYGHNAGDTVLCSVAGVLQKSVRKQDSVYRLGGEEFCLFLQVRNANELNTAAESIRARIQSLAICIDGQEIPVTGSLGGVMLGDGRSTLYSMLAEADKRLYAAKSAGRNCVVSEEVGDLDIA